MNKYFIYLFFFGLSFLLSSPVSASDIPSEPSQRMWVNAGYIENARDTYGGRLAYSHLFEPFTLTGRLTGMGTPDRVYPAVYPPPESSWDLNYILDFSVLGGIALIRDYGGFSFSGGVGYYRGEEENRFDYRTFQTIGFPIEAQIFVTPIDGFGLSLVWDMNFTSVSRHSSLFLGIQIGPMR
jgi:hypothetical protein